MERYLPSAFLDVDIDITFFMMQSSKTENIQVFTFPCVGLVLKCCVIYINENSNSSI